MINKAIFATALFVTSFSVVTASESVWYWVSVPSDPGKGYFIEEVLPNTIGFTEDETDYAYTDSNRTTVPKNFMSVLEEAEDYHECSEKLDDAIRDLRSFDSQDGLVVSLSGKDAWCGPGCYVDLSPHFVDGAKENRKKLMRDIEDDAEQCIEEAKIAEEEAEEERKRLRAERKHQRDIEEAVEECDFEFFDEEMTSRERMQTYNERIACKETGEPVEEVGNDTKTVEKEDLLKQIQVLLELIAQLQAQMTTTQR